MQADGADVVAALAPVGAGDANLGGGMKGIAQEAVSVQLQQPLTLLHVGLAPGQILRVPGVDEIHVQTARVEDLVEWDPVDAGGLHGDGRDPTLLEPIRQAMEIRGKAVKPSHRLGIALGSDGDVVRAVADVNPRGVRMHHLEAGIGRLQTTGEFFPLLPIEP